MSFNFSVVSVIEHINKAVIDEDEDTLVILLKHACLKLPALQKEESHLCLRMLKKVLVSKDSQNLWFDDIIQTVNEVNGESQNVKDLIESLVQLNLAVLKNNLKEFWNALLHPVLSTSKTIESSCKDVYFQMFLKALKKRGHNICPWIVCHTNAGNTVYIDVESYAYSWTTPKDFVPYARYLTRRDVKALIEKTNKYHINKYMQSVLEDTFTKLQAYCRGYLVRKNINDRLKFYEDNEQYVIKIQAWWRKTIIEKKYGTLIKMKAIEARLKRERKENPMAWYKIQVGLFYCNK